MRSAVSPLAHGRVLGPIDSEAIVVVADPHSPSAIAEGSHDHDSPSGSPSKHKRKKPFTWGEETEFVGRIEGASSKKRRKRYIFCACILCMVLLAAFAVLSYFLVTVFARQDRTTATPKSTISEGEVNYTECRLAWQDVSLAVLDNQAIGELPCASIGGNEMQCRFSVNCCWIDGACMTYKNQAECNTFLHQSDCEQTDRFCVWESPSQTCRRGNAEQENQTVTFESNCRQGWVTNKLQPALPCKQFNASKNVCTPQFGCCWGELTTPFTRAGCFPFKQKSECADHASQDDCENDQVGAGDRRTLCTWMGTKCVRGSTTPAPTITITRYPTNMATTHPTIAPTTISPTGKPSTLKPTVAVQSKPPSSADLSPSPTLALTKSPVTLVPTTSTPSLAPSRLRKRKTSFLILLADDMGWGDVSYTNPTAYYSTPNIDAMASSNNAIQMTRFHSAAISCSPTRASLLSVTNNVRDCVWGANSKWDKPGVVFRPEFPFQGSKNETLSALAQANGYRTIFLGKWHIGPVNQIGQWGFDSWIATGGNLPTFDSTCFCLASTSQCSRGHYTNPDKLAPNYGCWVQQGNPSTAALTNLVVRNRTSAGFLATKFDEFVGTLSADAAFFAVLGFNEPHVPFISPPWVRSELLKGPTGTLGTTVQSRAADYFGALKAVDGAVGKARNTLVQYRRDVDTLVLFASDNGPEEYSMGGWGSTGGLTGRKRSLYEGGHRVPGIIVWPRLIKSNIVTSNLISMMDVGATMMELILQDNYSLFMSLLRTKDGESMLESILVAAEGDPFDFQKSKTLQMCSSTVSGSRRACEYVATMKNNFKLITYVNSDGSINPGSAKLYDYEVSEDTPLPTTHPKWQELVDITDKWTKDAVGQSVRTCVFPA